MRTSRFWPLFFELGVPLLVLASLADVRGAALLSLPVLLATAGAAVVNKALQFFWLDPQLALRTQRGELPFHYGVAALVYGMTALLVFELVWALTR